MRLIELTTEQPHNYKKFFLQGLRDHQDCFRTSASDEMRVYFPTDGTPESFTLAAVSDQDELLGVVSFERESTGKMKHKALLFRMYVTAQFAGRGLGQALMEATLARARQLAGLEQIHLTVIASNLRAKRLYERFGFEVFSHEKNAIKNPDGTYFHEEQMVLFL